MKNTKNTDNELVTVRSKIEAAPGFAIPTQVAPKVKPIVPKPAPRPVFELDAVKLYQAIQNRKNTNRLMGF